MRQLSNAHLLMGRKLRLGRNWNAVKKLKALKRWRAVWLQKKDKQVILFGEHGASSATPEIRTALRASLPCDKTLYTPRVHLHSHGINQEQQDDASSPGRQKEDTRVFLGERPSTNIIRIEAWRMPRKEDDEYRGIFRDANGRALSGFFLRQGDWECIVFAVQDGHLKEEFPYPALAEQQPLPFQSPLLRWRNLAYRGGGGYILTDDDDESLDSHDYLLDDVIAGRKPIGFIARIRRDSEYKGDLVSRAKIRNLVVAENITDDRWCHVGFAQRGTIGEVFGDLNLWLQSYRLLGERDGRLLLTKEDEETLLAILRPERPLSDFLTNWDYANPKSVSDYAQTGLLLGYPIESTITYM